MGLVMFNIKCIVFVEFFFDFVVCCMWCGMDESLFVGYDFLNVLFYKFGGK